MVCVFCVLFVCAFVCVVLEMYCVMLYGLSRCVCCFVCLCVNVCCLRFTVSCSVVCVCCVTCLVFFVFACLRDLY